MAERPNVVIVAKDALIMRAGRTTVFVVEGDQVRERQVEIGITDRDWAEVHGGVSSGDRVVVVGQRDLADGDRVRVVGGQAAARR